MYRHQCDPSTTIFSPSPGEYLDEFENEFCATSVKRHCDCCGELRGGYKTVVGESVIQLCSRCVRVIRDVTGYA